MKFRSCYFVLLLGALLLTTQHAKAQIDDIGSLINAGVNDANTISEIYLTPMIKGLGTGLNTGWTHSASPGEFPHFYIGVRSGFVFIPSSERTFDVTALSLENLSYVSGPIMAPTANGPDTDGPTMKITKMTNGTPYDMGEVTLPAGSGLNFAPAPVIQAAVGLRYNTTLLFRFVPKITVEDGNGYMNGIGLQHGINQWLPAGYSLPIDLSVMFGYTIIKGKIGLDVTPENDPFVSNPYSIETWANQAIRSRTTAFTMNLIGGKRFSVFHVYGGLGYEKSKSSIKTIGSYPLNLPDPIATDPFHERIDMVINPIDFSVKSSEGMHLFAGTGIDMKVLKVFTEFTLSNYPIISFGLGFGW